MAEQVARLKILAQIEGLEGFDKLKGAFKGLQQAIGPSDQQISKARREILAFGEAGARSEQVLRGQVEALKALQVQATIGGAAYKQLARDVKALGEAYNETANQAKRLSDAQLRGQAASNKPSAFQQQIAALKRELNELNVLSAEYATSLANIQRREIRFGMGTARQGVVARNQAFENENFFLPDRLNGQPDLPNTTAALNQRLAELNDRLNNVTRGGERWAETQREITRLQRELNRELANPALDAARRRLEQSRATNSGSGFLAFSQGLDDRMAVQRSIERNRRRQAPAAIEMPMMETSELYRSIQNVGLSRISSQLQLMGNSYEQVAADIRRATVASDGSVNSLRAQRASWEALRDSLGNNKQALREVNKELAAVDRQLEKRGVGGGGIGQKVQAFGAIASGAIFGGPEGALGGIAGAALGSAIPGVGTVGGAFAGAAVGAQLGMLRQQVFAASEYAATLGRLNIALKELTTTSQQYAETQRVIQSISRELNVPVLEATQGFTKLYAAVKGAGGGVADAEVVFRGVSQAIKATGGTAEDVQNAMLAMSQIFSKGKVSAEELQGQLGERLPGAVTLFAQATGRSLPQLQKDLEQGVVGLNDLMKFAAALGDRYGDSARKMATSQEDATARMKVAIADLTAAFGSAVQPIVASITSIITKLAELATRALKAMGLVKGALGEMNAAQRDADLGQRLKDAGQATGLFRAGPLARQGYTSAEVGLLRRRVRVFEAAITPQESKAGLEQNLKYLQEAQNLLRRVPASSMTTEQINQYESDFRRIQGRIDQTTESLKRLKDEEKKVGAGLTNFASPKDEDGKDAEKARKEAERLAAEQQRLDEQVARAKAALEDATHRTAMDLIRKRYEYEQELINKQRENWVKSLTGAARTAGGLITSFYGQLDELTNRRRQAAIDVRNAQQALRSAENIGAVTGQGGIIGRTGNTGQSTGPHLDARWADGRRITAEDVDRYLSVNGRDPSSFGVTSPYGPRSMFGRNFHRGIDFGTPAGSAISLKSGASLLKDLGFTGAGGYAVEIMTPEGPMRLLHLQGSEGRTLATGKAGVAAQQLRDVSADSKTSVERVELEAASGVQKIIDQGAGKLADEARKGFVLDFTEQLRNQNAELQNSADLTRLRNQLELEGRRPEYIDGEVKKAQAIQQVAQANATAKAELDKLIAAGQGNSVQAQAQREAIASNNQQLAEFKRLTDEATSAQLRFNDALRLRQDFRVGQGFTQGVQQYVQSIGTMKDATAQLVQSGLKGVEDALVSLVTTGKANFQEFAASLLKDTARVIIQQLVLRSVLQAVGFLGGGGGFGGGYFNPMTGLGAAGPNFGFAKGGAFAQNGIIPFAMGGVVDKPTLFKFANGGAGRLGLMGEAGPEAIMPLRRGRDGRLGVAAAGGGDINVSVSVDASGSQVQGDSGRGEQLGRAVAAAVQQEIIRQKRNGGLLAT